MLLLEQHDITFLAWERVRYGDCPQCPDGGFAVWLYDDQRCFCIHCDYTWDKIDIRAPVFVGGPFCGEVAA